MDKITIAFWWNHKSTSDKRLCYLAFKPNDFSLVVNPADVKVDAANYDDKINQVFRDLRDTVEDFDAEITVEYKIVHDSHYHTDPFSVKVREHVKTLIKYEDWNLSTQQRAKLKGIQPGQPLYKFKTALCQYRLMPAAKGQTWQAHLWSVGLHATNRRIKQVCKEIYKVNEGIASWTKVEKQKFEAWYAQL